MDMAKRLIADAAVRLASAGVASPRVDAELLAAHVLGVPRGRLLLVDDVPPAARTRYAELVARRADRVPLQHLTGYAHFYGLDLAVGPGVFVPRPETELLVEWALTNLAGDVVVDLCAGSGAIGLAVASTRRDARVWAVERDPAALAWLRRNTDALGAGLTVVAGDATDGGVLADLDGRVDLVLSNPPYVPTSATLPVEVAAHDPAVALYGGPDGLAVIRPLLVRAAALLRPGGLLAMEHDDGHGDALADLLRSGGDWTEVVDHADLAGRPRFVTARRA